MTSPYFVFCMLLIFIYQTTAEPAFLLIADDFIATGFYRVENINFHLTVLVSKSLKSSRIDIKAYGMGEKKYKLGTYGSYGAEVRFVHRFDKTMCILTKGSSKTPVHYEPFFLQSLKYVGTENVDGFDMQKWKFNGEDKTGCLLIRQDGNGTVPYRVDIDEQGSMTFANFSPTSPSPSVFKFNTKGCKKMHSITRDAFKTS